MRTAALWIVIAILYMSAAAPAEAQSARRWSGLAMVGAGLTLTLVEPIRSDDDYWAYSAGWPEPAIDSEDWLPFMPWPIYPAPDRGRHPALKYGGVALAAAGAVLMLWPDRPAPLEDVSVVTTGRGVVATRSFGW